MRRLKIEVVNPNENSPAEAKKILDFYKEKALIFEDLNARKGIYFLDPLSIFIMDDMLHVFQDRP
jgi:hypothetical protein